MILIISSEYPHNENITEIEKYQNVRKENVVVFLIIIKAIGEVIHFPTVTSLLTPRSVN